VTSARVFISRPAMLTDRQATAKRAWTKLISSLGFAPLHLDRRDYQDIPWEQLRSAIRSADGALVLGFRQLSVASGALRPETPEALPAAGWYPTAWNQIEAGLAVMAALPVLVAPETGVTDGVFCPQVWGDQVSGLQVDFRTLGSEVLYEPALQSWAADVCRHADNRGRARFPGRTSTAEADCS
jgi:hypothetical protein